MSSDPVIRVSALSKCYEIYAKPQDRLRQSIHRRLRRVLGKGSPNYYREFWALRDITFEVHRGEAVGVIGRNGAGKSTLLQIISGTLSPTSGSVEIRGKVAALLELGNGFNPEFTGRENVFLNGAVLGLTEEEINNKFDEIAAFADIGDFLEQPVKIYSSGMLVRLAFAVNTCIHPEVLIVDEALAVGDAPFQSKCFKRLRQLIADGASILFVSHDISTVSSICTRALWLKNGLAEMWGEAKPVAKMYERFCWAEQGIVLERMDDQDKTPAPPADSASEAVADKAPGLQVAVPAQLFQSNPAFDRNRERSRFGTGDVVIANFMITDEAGLPVAACDYNDRLTFHYLLKVQRQVDSDFILGIRVRDLKGNFVYSANDINRIHRLTGAPGDTIVISAEIRFPLSHQDYVVLTGVFGFQGGNAFVGGIYDYSRSVIWDVIEEAAYVEVRPCKVMPLAGPVNACLDLRVEKVELVCEKSL
jgi:lipopolysaccharide transport system ATP-binding protein